MKPTLYSILSLLLFSAICVRSFAAPVDVNTADAMTIADALSGIGPKLGAAIVEYREANGPFKSVDDLLNVKGVGPKMLERIKADVLIEGESSTQETE
ncbi:MAG: helix-hairpin-helix domain-containing protein [Arenicellales bacterium]|nr:helix-hairpin-helix domain-containing protein [Arenicellales bacterium]